MSGGTLRGDRTRTPTHSVWELTSDGIVFGGSWYSSAANVRTGSGYDLGSGGLRARKRVSSVVSFPRKRESRHNRWTPASAGVTGAGSNTFTDPK